MTPVFQVSNEQKLQHFAPRLERIFSLLSSVFERFAITTFLKSDRAMSSNGPFSWDCTSSVILSFHMTFPKCQRGIIAPKHLYLYEFSVRKVSSLWVENGTEFLRFCNLNISCPRINITLIFMSSSRLGMNSRIVGKLKDRCFCCWFPVAIFVPLKATPTWRLHTTLYQFGWNVFPNSSHMQEK